MIASHIYGAHASRQDPTFSGSDIKGLHQDIESLIQLDNNHRIYGPLSSLFTNIIYLAIKNTVIDLFPNRTPRWDP